ncbi:MAG: ROK family protein [Pirellulales bacterium]|nr:ROK family protein [Pirellulales bacterium]
MPPIPDAAAAEPVVVAVDLGGTKLAAGLFTAAGVAHQRRATPLAGRQGRAVGALIVEEVRRLLDQALAAGHPVGAIGIAIPGIVDARTARVWAPNIPGWDDYPLRDEVAASLPVAARPAGGNVTAPAVPIILDSDRAAYILGEAWQGVARGCRDAIYLAVGTGIGAGILAGGQVLRGVGGVAGAIGWLALDRPFSPDYATCGCFELHASGAGLAHAALRLLHDRADYQGVLRTAPSLAAREVFDAYQAGDPLAHDVLRQAVEFWGMAVANLVSLFNPEKIIFGGGVFGPAVQFLPAIAAEARRWAQPISVDQVELVAARLGADAGLYGAARLALEAASLDPR